MRAGTECRRFLVSGRVQGVSYRAATRAEAQRLGILGWAENLPTGQVAVVGCGSQAALEALGHWLRQGPPAAQVQRVEERPFPKTACAGFEIR